MFRSVVYHRNSLIGEVEIHPKNSNLGTWTREIRISYISHPRSDRCPPLAILHTISTSGVCFMMESKRSANESLLFSVYSACLRENKTAVALVGEEELHLVSMPSRRNIPRHSCFWGYIIARGLYNSCLAMLNRRCLGIVFDLDETLLVANTMRSLEDKIDGLQRMISCEMDPQHANGMLAVIKRYQDDKSILKQYVDGDQVVENGKVFKTQSEAVPPLFGSHQPLTRPIIRLHEKNIILTRVDPSIRDTSVLVRLRPAWEDLRNYLTANGRKWFEVYVCTMAEKDYAIEMWRLLDPECNLINSSELLDRIVSVKSGLRKSLFSVFKDGGCHPKMSLVIDDRLEVWDEKDQSRVLAVPPFAPHFGPQAEATNDIPVLCAARNMARNVRGSFFKDFDVLLPRMSEISYEDEVDYRSAPDTSNYLISKDGTSTLIEKKNPLGFDGMADAEVERRLKGANKMGRSIFPISDNFDTGAVVPPGPTVITPTAPAVLLTTTQFPNIVVPGTLHITTSLPIIPEGPLPTQGEARKKREIDRRNRGDPVADNTEDENFSLIGVGEKIKDRSGQPIMKWDPKGKSVQVSTALPNWFDEKATNHARFLQYALYGKENLEHLQMALPGDLPVAAAHARMRSMVIDHFIGESYSLLLAEKDDLMKENEELRKQLADAYHEDNPLFLKEMTHHLRDGGIDVVETLKLEGVIKLEFMGKTFDEYFPGLKEKVVAAAADTTAEIVPYKENLSDKETTSTGFSDEECLDDEEETDSSPASSASSQGKAKKAKIM